MHDAQATRAALQVGAAVRVHPARVTAAAWTGEVVQLDAPGHSDYESWNSEQLQIGLLVRPTMPGRGWSKAPVWLPYDRVTAMVEA